MDEKQTAALREAFEQWEVSENGWDKDDLRRHPDGIYYSARIHEDWSSWLACYQHLAPQWQPIETAPQGTMILCANMNAMQAKDWAYVGWIVANKIYGHRSDMPTHWMPPRKQIAASFFFPPCTDVAVSGARWFKDKGIGSLIMALRLFEVSVKIAEWTEAPYLIENPVSTISTYWRKPDYSFHPHEFTGLCADDNYSKLTCLWTGGGFIMPPSCRDYTLGEPDTRIHRAPPGPERANFRSATPMGFARAVYEANRPDRIREAA